MWLENPPIEEKKIKYSDKWQACCFLPISYPPHIPGKVVKWALSHLAFKDLGPAVSPLFVQFVCSFFFFKFLCPLHSLVNKVCHSNIYQLK